MKKLLQKKSIWFLVLLCAFWTLLSAGATNASAANVLWLMDGKLKVGSENWNVEEPSYFEGALTASVTATAGECGNNQTNASLKFTNDGGSRALLKFKIEYDYGTMERYPSGSTYYKALSAGGSDTLAFASTASTETTCVLTLSEFSFEESDAVTVTFAAAENGGYTVAGSNGSGIDFAVSDQDVWMELESADTYTLRSQPAEGYKLIGWKLDGAWISLDDPAELSFTDSGRLEAVFAEASCPVYRVGEEYYTDLDSALSAAEAQKPASVVMEKSGVLPAGEYAIPSGVKLVISDGEEDASSYQKPTVVTYYAVPSVSRTLTMLQGASITIQNGGELCVRSRMAANGSFGLQSWNGTPSGPYGHIRMDGGSSITLESGAALYCFGYISGSGSVTAKSGSTVRECFQIRGWRAATTVLSLVNNKIVFPFNQYYIQNIEVPLTIYSGASERLVSGVNALDQIFELDVPFFVSGGSGMFRVNSGYVVKDYIESSDRLEIAIYGSAELSAIEVTGLPTSIISSGRISSADYNMPLTNNITLSVRSGSFAIKQPIDLLPGTKVEVAEGAELKVDHCTYLYDADEWGDYAGDGLKLVPAGYSTAHGATTVRGEGALTDAELSVEGIVTVSGDKYLYTTEGGANINPGDADSGKILFNNGQSKLNGETRQWNVIANAADIIPANPARLRNANGGYTETKEAPAGTGFTYNTSADMWIGYDPNSITYNVVVNWGDLSFTYKPEVTWNGEEMQYEGGGGVWVCSGSNSVTVTNGSGSSSPVLVTYAFTAQAGLSWTAAMNFFRDSAMTVALPSEPVNLIQGSSETVYMMLAGTPDAEFADGMTVGTVKVTIYAEE